MPTVKIVVSEKVTYCREVEMTEAEYHAWDNKLDQTKGREYDIDAVRNLMDDDLAERIHGTVETEQEFVDAYCALHLTTYGEPFVVN